MVLEIIAPLFVQADTFQVAVEAPRVHCIIRDHGLYPFEDAGERIKTPARQSPEKFSGGLDPPVIAGYGYAVNVLHCYAGDIKNLFYRERRKTVLVLEARFSLFLYYGQDLIILY
jgi:hypothetical protein